MLFEKKLIVNSDKGNLLTELVKSMNECVRFYFSVAFVNFSGLQLLLDPLKEAEQNGVKGKIITSTYLNFTDAKALEKIREFQNVDLKVFVTDKEIGFHTKAYIFEYQDSYKVIIGSSNITQSALKSNIEWNVEIIAKEDATFIKEVLKEYDQLWESSVVADQDFINRYEEFLKSMKKVQVTQQLIYENREYIVPNRMQRRAMENLERLRSFGENKALVIAATGTGKTYMSAFDVKNVMPKKLLFIVHREEILKKAKETFEKLLPNDGLTFGLLTGNHKQKHVDYVFATIQTISKCFDEFNRDEFDYLIIDEAHHATSPSYQDVLNYFEPEFTLGMTATPERSDSRNVFDLFDNNVALEVRLHEALEDELVIPFHYFGITDIDGIDLSDVSIVDIDEITKRLKVNERVDFIIEKMNFYSHDGEKRKCLGFCAGREHAQYMAAEFNKRGYKSMVLLGDDGSDKRELYIKRLEDDADDLEFIFTVDIFNEGVDIPSVNTVLMLRPTNSPIIFIQQLGRGLRKYKDKSFLTVLDFIGNHNKTFLIALALNGSRYYDKESLKVAVATGFANIPGCTHIQMDRISQERILSQIDQENFNSMKYLREEYFEFKKLNQGRTPYYLRDYLKYDGAPDPIKFVQREKTYLQFVAKAEKDDSLKALLQDDAFEGAMKELSSKLPLKRVYEFVIMKYLLDHEEISLETAKHEILKIVKEVDEDSVLHALEVLNQDYYDSGQKKSNRKLFDFANGRLSKTSLFTRLLANPDYNKYIEDIMMYGIFRYEKEFKGEYYGVPHLKLYEQYQMVDAALLSNYRKSHSAFRGSGLLANGNDYFLFIDLHKEEDIDERLNYQDKFLDERYFQWQSPNSTSQGSERGQNIIHNDRRGINLHLFVRKYREIDGKTEPYIYIGKGDTVHYEGEKPITVKIKLDNEIPANLFTEFTIKV
ncbi:MULTISPECIES: DEAD/DEAH box helicase [unclassified Bacillus (in: firmicutes)]|uniref:DEAD/DEAH box helicase n=1 Tax=unclassified Bacillus (in: firmicutes) TaxID=185979 RepID=UPI0008EFE8FB|nr:MULTISPECIES: DEAD/DEAH box helicase [unclassified Bacillus (in: firmicutes)]SFB07039.1 Helicase conserved C-terminal domain-containing protein [Bacillus sp. UNCCL13]SFQ87488.1 Helicase conserved C-terminal domain-containing protein [Bacillus sp. cl95]